MTNHHVTEKEREALVIEAVGLVVEHDVLLPKSRDLISDIFKLKCQFKRVTL